MAKYIDSEKLKELIDEKWKELANRELKVGGHQWDPEINTYLSVLKLVDSLQQDQSNSNLEEKAKAFDEALERARKMLNMILDNELIGFPDQIREIFPQLCENEDERIRKSIIHILQVGGYMSSEEKDKAFAYLEKMKDASKAIEAVDRIDKYIDEHLANAHDMKDSNPDKKYYRGWDDALGKMSGILQDAYSGEKQKEQEIDVKDYRLRDTWEYIDEFIKKFGRVPKDIDELSACVDYVINHKSIDEKEKKSVEWSEEDEKNISAIKIALRDAKLEAPEEFESNGVEMTVKDFENAELWLKSLHSSWKPSEKEKIALRTAICILTEENCPKTVANLQAILDVFDDKESRKD